jgi:hypothetical protein
MHITGIVAALALGLLALHGCSDDGAGSGDGGQAATCTLEQTKQLASATDMSKLTAVAADETTKQVLLEMVAESCCAPCSTSSATPRPLLTDAHACVSCSAAYVSGDPAQHIEGCAGPKVCKPAAP